jgi:hypothetical protein
MKIAKCLLFLFILRVCLLSACTTVRPLTKKEIKEMARLDTLRILPMSFNKGGVSQRSEKKDTVYVERVTRVEANTTYLDTAMLTSYLERFNARTTDEIKILKATVLSMQALVINTKIISDSARSRMQRDLTLTKKEQIVAKQTIATNNQIIYEVPKYIYFALVFLIVLLFVPYHYLKRRLSRKIRKRRLLVTS